LDEQKNEALTAMLAFRDSIQV